MTIIRGPKVEEVDLRLTNKEDAEARPAGGSAAGE